MEGCSQLTCDEHPLAGFFFLKLVTPRQLFLGTDEPRGGLVSIQRMEGDEVATLLLLTQLLPPCRTPGHRTVAQGSPL